MATKVKPTRLQVTGTPQAGDVPMYVDADNFQWGAGGGGGSGDVVGPASSTDGNIVLFNGATGKVIKDSGVGLSSKLDASALSNNAYGGGWNGDTTHTPTKDALYDKIHTMDVEIGNKAADTTVVKLTGNQTIAGTKTFSTSPVVPSKTTTATNTGTAIATEAQVYEVASGLGTAAACNTGTGSGNVPVLDSNGKLDKSTLPGVALTDTFTVSTSSDLTTLSSAEQGDLAIVTTENKTYVLASEPYSTAANWKEILSPTGGVTSVNTQTGAVTLDADDISDSTTTNKFVTATDKSTWSGKQDALTLPSTPTQGNLVTWGADNETLVDGGAVPTGVPSGGTDGQVLSKVSGNVAWDNLPAETVVSGDSGTTYTIKVANSDPGSGTPATTITFVTA